MFFFLIHISFYCHLISPFFTFWLFLLLIFSWFLFHEECVFFMLMTVPDFFSEIWKVRTLNYVFISDVATCGIHFPFCYIFSGNIFRFFFFLLNKVVLAYILWLCTYVLLKVLFLTIKNKSFSYVLSYRSSWYVYHIML